MRIAWVVPKSWTQDPERCRAAHVPAEVIFATKPELVARMLWRTLDAGLSACWVTGDTVYGSHRPLREGLEARTQAYALAVSCQEQVQVQGEHKRVDRIAEGLEADHWHRLSGRPHTIEIWYVLHGETLSMLSGGLDQAE